MAWQPMVLYPPPVPERARAAGAAGLTGPLPDEAELTAGVRVEPGRRYGFFTDTTLCIGCKACETACKEWNLLPAEAAPLTGMSYDNTAALSASTWRHVSFVEQLRKQPGPQADGRVTAMAPFQSNWLMMSDVCKHCERAGCLEACPTGAIIKTEFDTVLVQTDVCNGCGYCVPACPFAVIEVSPHDGKAHKCTLCHDRLQGGLEPACAKACPTNAIQFGELEDLQRRAGQRVDHLHSLGVDDAYLYGTPGAPGATGDIGSLNAFFLLIDRPEVYNLPAAPVLPSTRTPSGLRHGLFTLATLSVAAVLAFAVGHKR